MALPREKKNLVAVVHKDKIVIYEDLKKEKIFTIVHVYKASSVIWFDYGFQRQAFLIVSSHHKLIEVYEYKSKFWKPHRNNRHVYSNNIPFYYLFIVTLFSSVMEFQIINMSQDRFFIDLMARQVPHKTL